MYGAVGAIQSGLRGNRQAEDAIALLFYTGSVNGHMTVVTLDGGPRS